MTKQDRAAPVERAKSAGSSGRKALKFFIMCLLFTSAVLIAKSGDRTDMVIVVLAVCIGYAMAKL